MCFFTIEAPILRPLLLDSSGNRLEENKFQR